MKPWRRWAAAWLGAMSAVLGTASAEGQAQDWRALYAPPVAIPFPAANRYSAAKAALGRELFFDPRLSGNGRQACASCHDPRRAWSDDLATAVGAAGQRNRRRTPTLWNLAWAETLFWDGRADSLESQALQPIQSATEMDHRLADLIMRLAAIPAYRQAFARAFPESPTPNADHLAAALATYERTLVSNRTPFDRWLGGEDGALGPSARHGFDLFNGKAHCAVCHAGWNFTDQAFHDIGLPATADRGRGATLALSEADYAFKTPTLREVARHPPYMHDGSLPTLTAVIRHYNGQFERRPSLSADLQEIHLDAGEQTDLLAFLEALSAPPSAPPLVKLERRNDTPAITEAVATQRVSQRDKAFTPGTIVLKAGALLIVQNDDIRTHNVRIHHPQLDYNSGAQKPGMTVTIAFPAPGTYHVFCGIHPRMKLDVTVGD
ncbi:MAG: cytochrome c peroxidase [Gammaproteobacteria bacterium]